MPGITGVCNTYAIGYLQLLRTDVWATTKLVGLQSLDVKRETNIFMRSSSRTYTLVSLIALDPTKRLGIDCFLWITRRTPKFYKFLVKTIEFQYRY